MWGLAWGLSPPRCARPLPGMGGWGGVFALLALEAPGEPPVRAAGASAVAPLDLAALISLRKPHIYIAICILMSPNPVTTGIEVSPRHRDHPGTVAVTVGTLW